MIYTVTCNPSLDYIVTVEGFAQGKTNRASGERLYPGGKGLNVSMMLKNLGTDSLALGFAAGFTGEEIIRRLEERGCKSRMIRLSQGNSRINIKLRAGEETEINGAGPKPREAEIRELMEILEELKEGDFLVLAGSVPAGAPDSFYEEIMERLSGKGVRFVVDATRELLLRSLKYRPFLVKPNHHELGELFGTEIRGREEAALYADRLRRMGARSVLVSMAGEGAVLLAGDGSLYQAEAPGGIVKNSVGAGDSMVAGFLAGYTEKGTYGHAFRMGLCAGSASAFSEWLAERETVMELYREHSWGAAGESFPII